MRCKDDELISIVTPVYNAAEFLPRLYGCLRAQSYGNWEWVVVNDGSTDGSGTLLKELAENDGRIRYSECRNSGSAKQPRDKAVALASARYVLCIDADDYVPSGYVQTMYERKCETGANIVYPIMRSIAGDRIVNELPAAEFDRRKVYRGRNLVRETLDGWRIGCVGGLYDKTVWTNTGHTGSGTEVWMNSDEVDERLYLTNAGKVAFADTYYYYVTNDFSITRIFSPKLFQRLKTDRILNAFIKDEFGRESEEYARAGRQMFRTWRDCMTLYVIHRHRLGPSHKAIYGDLRENFNMTDVSLLSAKERLKYLNLFCFSLTFLLFRIRYSPARLSHYIKSRLANRPHPAENSMRSKARYNKKTT